MRSSGSTSPPPWSSPTRTAWWRTSSPSLSPVTATACATAVTRGELFRAAMAHRPDACLVDLRLLDGSALDVISLLHRNAPNCASWSSPAASTRPRPRPHCAPGRPGSCARTRGSTNWSAPSVS
ncbi:hypothetical protein ACFQZC_04435 [Streptacidiphilus monticola]